MSERPINERPAARPVAKATTPVTSSPADTPIEYVKAPSLWSSLGCFGWTMVIAFAIIVISAIGGTIQSEIDKAKFSSGTETYEVTPDTIDPRSKFQISEKCEAGMAASAADHTENGERLLKETGNLCGSREEWEAALYKYPRAIGLVDKKYLDGSEFGLLCNSYPAVNICKGKE